MNHKLWETENYGFLKSRGPFGRFFISLWDWVTRSYFQITLKVPFYQKSDIIISIGATDQRYAWPSFSFSDESNLTPYTRADRTVTRFLGQVVIYDFMIMRTCVQLITPVASKRIPNSKRKCFNFWNSSKSHFQTFNELAKKLNLEHPTE